jgi:hypothetical protein
VAPAANQTQKGMLTFEGLQVEDRSHLKQQLELDGARREDDACCLMGALACTTFVNLMRMVICCSKYANVTSRRVYGFGKTSQIRLLVLARSGPNQQERNCGEQNSMNRNRWYALCSGKKG